MAEYAHPYVHAAQPTPGITAYQGLYRWITTVDHKDIGLLYILTSLVFFLISGLQAIVMRIQLATPNERVLDPQTYNEFFTMHGTTMIFLVGMPVLIGLANYLVPLMIGARDMAYPRLNAFSYWLFLFGGLFLYFSFFAGAAPDAMWFMYPPYTERPYTTLPRPDYWSAALLVSGVGTIIASINFIATIVMLRAPGMKFTRLPLFVWTVLGTSFIILWALPPLAAVQIMLLFDRVLGANFFVVPSGGNVLLWEHVFWSFGHPEVYILILPAFGVISEVIPIFARKPIFGYPFIVGSTITITFLSFLVWAHHMFTSGLGLTVNSVFAATSMLIAVPTGVKIFNWTATMWKGSLRLTTSMLFAISFLIEFVIGGLTGPMLATTPVDWQVHDSYFVVAHFHYVLYGGTILGLYAGAYYWFPKFTGRMLSERIGLWHVILENVGMTLAFFPMHILGLLGMPRHVYTYPNLPGLTDLNLTSTVGALILVIATLVFLYNFVISLFHGEIAGDDPWDAWTLEWATSSPPPPYNFETIPPVHSRRPLWDLKQSETESTGRT
jgi:cytochrome c oxidase subunit I